MASLLVKSAFLALLAVGVASAPTPTCTPTPTSTPTPILGDTVVGPENLVFEASFDDNNIDEWWMQTTNCDYYMDITPSTINGVDSPALRVGEIDGDGEAIVKYLPTFDLEAASSYQIAFSARSAYVDSDGTVVPALGNVFGEYIQFVVFNSGGNIYNVRPGKGEYWGNEWYRWHFTFPVESDQDGPAYFGMIFGTTGTSIDWYIDDITIIKVD